MNLNKHVWEGWTVQDFIDNLERSFDTIMQRKPFTSKKEIRDWCKDNQPYYKKYIKEVVDYFITKANLK